MYDKRQVQKRTNFKKRRRKQFDVGLKPINFRATPLSKFLRAVSKQTKMLCSCFRKRKSENKINEMEFDDTNLLQRSTEKFSRTNKEDLITILKEITSDFFAQRKQEQTFTSHNPVSKAKSESSILSATKKIIRTTQSDIYKRKLYHSQLEMILDHKSPPRRPNVSPFLTMSFFTLRKEQKYNTYPVHVNFKTNDDEIDLTETCNKSSQYSETETSTHSRKDILIRHNVKTSTRGLQKYNDTSTQFDDITSQLSKYGNIKQKVAQYYEINPTHKTNEFRENEKLKTSLDTNAEMGKGKLIYSHGKLARNLQDNEKVPSTNREALFLFTNERATFESTDDSTPAPSINKIQAERLPDRKKYTCIDETELQATSKYFAEFVDLQHINDCCTSTSETCVCTEMYPKFKEWYDFLQHNMQDQKKIKHDVSNKIKNDSVVTSPLANKNSTYKGNKQKEVTQHHSDDNKVGNNETAITDIFDDIKRQEKEKKSLEELRIENRNIMEILNQRYPTFVGMSIDGNIEDDEIKNETLPKKSKEKKIKTTRVESTKVPKIIIKEKSGKKRRITFQVKKDEIATTQNEETTPVIESTSPTTEKISEMKDLFQIFLPETDCNPNNEETNHASENPTLTLDSLSNIEKIFKGILIDLPNSKRKISPNPRQPSEQEIKRYKEWSSRDTEYRKPSMTNFPTNYELKPLHPDLVKKLSPDHLPTKSIVPLLKQSLEKSNMPGQLLNLYNVSEHKKTSKEVKVDDMSDVQEDNDEPALSSISSTIIAKSSKPTMRNALIQSDSPNPKETNKYAQVVLHLKNQKTQSSSSYLRDVFKKESKNKVTPKLSQTSSKSSVSSFIKSLLICVRYSESQTSVCDMSFQSDMPDQKDFGPKVKRKTSRKLILHTTEQKSKFSQSESSSSLKADKGTMKESAKLKSIGVQAITTQSVKDKNISSPSFTRIKEKKPVYCDAFSQTARIRLEEIAESSRQTSGGPFTEGSYCDFDIISRPSSHRRSKRTTKTNDMETLSDNKKTFSRVMKSCFPRNFLTSFPCICQEKASSTLSVVEDADEKRDSNLTILMSVRSSLLSTGVSVKPSITPSDEISRHLSSSSTVTRDFARKIIETRNEDTLKIIKSISVSDVSSKEYERIKNVKSSSHEYSIKNDNTQMVVEKSDFMLVNVSSGDSHFVYGNLNSEINSFSDHSSSTIAIKRESRVILQTVVNSSNSLISNRHGTNNDSKIDKLLSFISLSKRKKNPSSIRQNVDEYTLSAIQLSNENIGVSSSLLRSVSKKGLKFTNDKSNNQIRTDDKLTFNSNLRRKKEIQPKVAQNLDVDFASKSSSIIELLPQTSIKSTNQIRTDDKLVFHCIRRRKKQGQSCDDVESVCSSFIELLPKTSAKSNSLSEDDELSERNSESKGSLSSSKSRKSKKSKKSKKTKKPRKLGKHQMSSEVLLRGASHITIDEEFIERIRFLRLKSGLREHLSEKRNLKLLPVFGTYKTKHQELIDKKLPPVLDKIDATVPIPIETDITEISKPEESETSLELDVDKEQLNINKPTAKEENVYKIKNFNNIIDEKPINKYEIFNEIPSSEKSVSVTKPDDEVRLLIDAKPKEPLLEDEQIENVIQLDTMYEPTVEEEEVIDKKPEDAHIHFKNIAEPPTEKKEPKYDDDEFVKFERIDGAPAVDEIGHNISFRVHPHDYSRVELNFKDFEIILKPPSDDERNLEDFKVTYLPDKIIITLPWPGQARKCILGQLGKKSARKIFLKRICQFNKQCLIPLRHKPKHSTNACNIGTMTKETVLNMASRIKAISKNKDTQTKNKKSGLTEKTSKSLKKEEENISSIKSDGTSPGQGLVKRCSCITQYSQVFIAIKEPDERLVTPDQLTSEDGRAVDYTTDVFPTDSFNKNESQANEEIYKTDKNANECILPLKEYFDQKSLEDIRFPSEKSSKDVQKENYPQIAFEINDTENDSQNKIIEILEDAVKSESNVDGSDRKIQVNFPKTDTEQTYTSDDLKDKENDSQKKVDVEILEDVVESDFEITEDDIEVKTEELLENVVENVSSVYVSDHTDGNIQESTSSILSIEDLLQKCEKEGKPSPDEKQDTNETDSKIELPDESSGIRFNDESVSSKTKYCGIEHFILEKLIQMHKDKSQNKRKPPEHKLKVPEKNEESIIKTHQNKQSQTNFCSCRKDDRDDENNDVSKHYRRKLFNGIRKRCFKSQCRLAGGYCPYHHKMVKFNDANSKKRSEQNFNFYMSFQNGSENYKTKDVENIKIRKSDQAEFASSSNYNLSYYDQVTDAMQNNDEESYILVPIIARSKQNVRFVDSKIKKLFPFYENITEELESSSSSNIELLSKENYSFASNCDTQRLYQSKCYKSKDVSITRRNCEFFEFHSSTFSSNSSTRFFTESTIKSSSVIIAKTPSKNISESSITSFSTNNETSSKDTSKSSVKSYSENSKSSGETSSNNIKKSSFPSKCEINFKSTENTSSKDSLLTKSSIKWYCGINPKSTQKTSSNDNSATMETSPEDTTSEDDSENTSEIRLTMTTSTTTPNSDEVRRIIEMLYELCPHVLYDYYRRQFQNS